MSEVRAPGCKTPGQVLVKDMIKAGYGSALAPNSAGYKFLDTVKLYS